MVPGYEYDIFISYCHVDNATARPEEVGWIEQFHKYLEVQLGKRVGRIGMVQIWRDRELDGSQLFDTVIQNRINRSALFLALTSPGYFASEYCQQELQWFHQKAPEEELGLLIGERMRIFNVLLYNIPHDQWPEEFGRTSGFQCHDAEYGEPSDPAGKEFQDQIRNFDAETLKALRNE